LGETKIEDCGFVELEKNGEEFSVIRMDGVEIEK